MSHITQSRKGFTLIEMLVVIAIIAILAGMLLPVLNQIRRYTKRTKAKEMIYQAKTAFKQYLVDYRKFPNVAITRTDTNVLNILSGRTHNSLGHKYMDVSTNEFSSDPNVSGLRDPWGELYWVTVDNGLGGDTTGAYDHKVRASGYADEIEEEVIVWSTGEDKSSADAQKQKDDVRSWN